MTKREPYAEYKATGIDWLPEVPVEWEIDRLKSRVRLITDRADEKSNPVALENIEGWTGRLVASDTEFAAEGIKFAEGDLLFGKLRPYLAKSWTADRAGEAVGDFYVMRPRLGVNPRFLNYLTLTPEFISLVDGSTYGSKMPRASWDFIANVRLPFPNIEVQTHVVSFLDRETAQIDDLIGKQEQLIELLVEKRQSIITHAITKGLDPLAPTKPSGISWLGDVPATWTILPFRLAADYQEGPGIMASDFIEDGIPLLRISGVKGSFASLYGCKYLDPSKVESKWRHFRLKAGDILISASASTGTVSEVDETTAGSVAYTGIIRLRPKEKTTKDFLKLLVVSGPFLTQVDLLKTGSTMQHYGPSHLDQMKFSFPPLMEQRKIVNHVNDACSKIDVLMAKVRASIGLLQERRSALIFAAVTGKITVSPVGTEA